MSSVLSALALPAVGLPTVFVVALVSATLLPLGSEPAVAALVLSDPSLFWPAVAVATLGNTAGGAISWWMGWGAERAYEQVRHQPPREQRLLVWLRRFGPKACVLSWLPVVGDPLCLLAGWLRLPFWPCVAWMALGKALRYTTMTALTLWIWPWLSPWLAGLASRF